jgi:integrase
VGRDDAGARRGELCAIRWSSVLLEEGRETIWLRNAVRRTSEGWAEGDLKTHQQRRIAIDAETADVLREHRERCEGRARALGSPLSSDAYAFSNEAESSTFLTPDSVTQRYDA